MRSSVNELVDASEKILDYIKSSDQNLFPLLQQLRDSLEDRKDESKIKPVLLHEKEVADALDLFRNEGDSPSANLAKTALYYIRLTSSLLKHRGLPDEAHPD